MVFYLIGIDYKSASLEVREEVYRKRREIAEFLADKCPQQASILFTCNRMEIYGIARGFVEAFEFVGSFLNNFRDFTQFSYIKYGRKKVFEHALRLASGLESQIRGEFQIIQQLNYWLVKEALAPGLYNLWKEALALSEDIRRQAGFNEPRHNIVTLVFKDLDSRIRLSPRANIILVGTGKIAQLIAAYLPMDSQLYIVAGKNFSKATVLAKQFNARAIAIEDLVKLLPYADVLLSATSSPHYVLKKEHFLNAGEKRKHPFFVYDLALPRDIEPGAGDIPGVFLQNLEDLKKLFFQENKNISSRILLAEYLVKETMQKHKEHFDESFKDWNAAQPVGH